MVGEIVNVSVDESALTPDGEVDVAKFHLTLLIISM